MIWTGRSVNVILRIRRQCYDERGHTIEFRAYFDLTERFVAITLNKGLAMNCASRICAQHVWTCINRSAAVDKAARV
jgi:hypothetical protein